MSYLKQAVQTALANILPEWENLRADQIDSLVEQVYQLATDNDLEAIATLGVDSADTAALLADAMQQIAHWAADQARQENGGQAVDPDQSDLGASATVVAAGLAAELAVSASRSALRELGTGMTARRVADSVRVYLNGLSMSSTEAQAGGALHGAVNSARLATFEAGPVGSLYGHEVNDANTCPPCSAVNGRFLGTTDNINTVLVSYPAGAYGGYVHCQGGSRCRGTIFGVWRQGAEEE